MKEFRPTQHASRNVDLTHTADLWGRVEKSDIEIMQIKYICIETKLTDFCYEPNKKVDIGVQERDL